MTIQIDKLFDMAAEQKKLAWKPRKFAVCIVLAAAAPTGAGVGIGSYLTRRPQTVVIQVPAQAK